MPNINKEEFDKKLRALRTKYAIEDIRDPAGYAKMRMMYS